MLEVETSDQHGDTVTGMAETGLAIWFRPPLWRYLILTELLSLLLTHAQTRLASSLPFWRIDSRTSGGDRRRPS